MLSWFKDAALTLPISSGRPKWISFPLKGGVKTTSLWLGDAYISIVAKAILIGDTTILLTQVDELPQTGVLLIDQEQISYTGITTSPPSVTGCTRAFNSTVASAHNLNSIVHPQITYTSGSNIAILVNVVGTGPAALGLSSPEGTFGPPGTPLLLAINSIDSGISGAIKVNLQMTMYAGPEHAYTNLGLTPIPLSRPGDSGTSFATISLQPFANISIQQRDQGLKQRLRLLPINQKVNNDLTGFTWGQYRWRDNTTENAQSVVPTLWDVSTDLIRQDFIGGVGSIGETNDMEPIDLEEVQSSIFLRSLRGQYFTGVKRYYFPSDNFNLEFLPCYPGLSINYQLLKPPREQTPVFVGNWRLDTQSFYEYNMQAHYKIPSTFNLSSHEPQFIVDRKTGILTVNPAVQVPQSTILLGILSGGITEYFDIPVYPIDKIIHLYTSNPTVPIANFTFNRETGSITFPQAPGTKSGQPLFAVVDAAIAILYEYDVADNTELQNTNSPDELNLLKNTRLLTPDLNPAFSGLSQGYLYLQHRLLKPVAVTLSADKPQIAIPPTLSTIIGLIAYGPVFYNGDHALLTALAIGSQANEIVPGAQLEVIPGGLNPITGLPLQNYPFRGLINGIDPTVNDVVLVTGGDGIANLVFQPEPNFGYYIPKATPWSTTSVTYTPTTAVWSSTVGTITFTSPISHKFVINTAIRLTGFTPSAWNGDYQITSVNRGTNSLTISITSNPGTVSVMGIAGPIDTLLMPVPVPINQLWAGPPLNEGWLEFIYSVLSNDPLFGITAGDPTQGQIPFVTNGTINGNITITNASWTGGVVNFTLASAPTNLVVGQNISITGCTTSTLNGFQNVLSIFQVSTVWHITTPTSTVGTSSEAEGGASFTYSNFRTNGVVHPWNKIILAWQASTVYQVGDTALDSNGELQQVTSVTGTGTSNSSAPVWNTVFGGLTTDNPGGNQVVWTHYGKPGRSTSIPIHAYDKNGVDYSSGIFSVVGNAQIVAGSPNTATIQVSQITGGTISPGDQITISGATSPSLNGIWIVTTASLATNIWTVTFHTAATPFASLAQTNGILTDTLFTGNVVKLVFNTGLPNASQTYLQAYFFQFVEREIIQLRVVGTNILSNSIMLEMETPQQVLENPYLILSTDQNTHPYYAEASLNSRFNINRLGITPPVISGP